MSDEAAVLKRLDDGLQKMGVIKFLEFDEETGRGKALHDKPEVGFSIIVNPQYGVSYTWMTSVITEVISDTEVKTENSHYKIESK